MINYQLFKKISLFVFISTILVNCIPTVSLEDIYKAPLDASLSGSKNIKVVQTSTGMKVTGSKITVVEVTNNKYDIYKEPKGDQIEYKMTKMVLNPTYGFFYAKAQIELGEDSEVSANLPTSAGIPENFSFSNDAYKVFGMVPGTPGSENVNVTINSNLGHTEVAGLIFKNYVSLNVWEDGTVEVDQKDIVVSDKDGQMWISKKVKIGDKTAIIITKQN